MTEQPEKEDIVDRHQMSVELRAEIARLRDEIGKWKSLAMYAELRAEIERLTTENWQLKQACGYPIPADKETPQNPFKCGTCDAKTNDIISLTRQRDQLVRITRKIVDAWVGKTEPMGDETFDEYLELIIEEACTAIAAVEEKP